MIDSTLDLRTAGARAIARASALSIAAAFRAYTSILILLMILLFALGSCGGSGNGAPPDLPLLPVLAAVPEPLTLHLNAPAQARAGGSVPLRLVLQNEGNRPVDVGFGGRPIAFDFVVLASDGSVVWSRLEGVLVPAILQIRTLVPGEVVEFAAVWDQRDNEGRRVPSGSYRIRGVLPVEGVPHGWTTEAHTITIGP